MKGHQSSEKQRRSVTERNKRSVRRDDGKVYEFINDAAEEIGVCGSAIANAIKHGQRSGGYRWEYVEDKTLTTIESIGA